MSRSIVSYVASKNPFQLDISVVQKRESTKYRNWIDKVELTNFVDSLPIPTDVECYMHIKCACGLEHRFLTKDDVPSKDFKCKCNRKIIEYEQK